MQISGRNQLQGKIKNIKADSVSAEVILDVGGQEICSTITNGSVEQMGLKPGDQVTALIKASSVMLMK